ncbi:MAG: Rieske (2Fe-2S) domain protein [Cyanobacteriota bacterium]
MLAANELPSGSRQVVKVNRQKILLLNHEGTIHAVSNQCPHLNLPMKNGKIQDGKIICPFHRSAFELCSGAVQDWVSFPPVVGQFMGKLSTQKALPIFPVRVEKGDIQVDLS